MEALIDRDEVVEIAAHFDALNSFAPLTPITSQQDYDRAISALNRMLDAGAGEEDHPLAGLLATIGTLIGAYEDTMNPPEKVSPTAMLRFLMEQHRLSQSDLPEIGTQGVVSEVLNGKRELNVRQIRALSERFAIPAGVFIQ